MVKSGGAASSAFPISLLVKNAAFFVCWPEPCRPPCRWSCGYGSRRGLAGLAAFRLLVMARVAALLDSLRFVCCHGSRRGLAGLAAFRLLVMALVVALLDSLRFVCWSWLSLLVDVLLSPDVMPHAMSVTLTRLSLIFLPNTDKILLSTWLSR